MFNLRNLFQGQPKPDDLRQAIGALDIAREATGQRRAALMAERETVYVTGDDAAIAGHQEKIGACALELDKLDVQAGALRRKLAEAEAAERLAQLDALHKRGVSCQAKASDLVGKYVADATRMRGLLSELLALDLERGEINRQLAAAGDPRTIDPVEQTLTQRADQGWTSNFAATVRLPDPSNNEWPIWPVEQGSPTKHRESAAARVRLGLGETVRAAS